MARRYKQGYDYDYDYDDEYNEDDDDYDDDYEREVRRRKSRRDRSRDNGRDRDYSRSRRKGSALGHFFTFLSIVVLGFVGFFAYMYLSGKVVISSSAVDDAKDAVVKKAVTAVIEKEIKNQTGEDVDLEAMKESMEPEDQEKVDELMDKYADEDTVNDVISAYKDSNGDLMEMKDTLTSIVDPGDIEEMGRLYQKYGDTYSGGQ
ncbi:MAG: hypothetical protein K6E33_03130 [Lachnospiraceae bacterium]|nr:hypothetical protein [Lachnospiraceae bacterium]